MERKPEGERDAGRAAEQGGGRGREGADDSVMKGFGVRSPRLWPRLEERQIEEKGRKIAAEMDPEEEVRVGERPLRDTWEGDLGAPCFLPQTPAHSQ